MYQVSIQLCVHSPKRKGVETLLPRFYTLLEYSVLSGNALAGVL